MGRDAFLDRCESVAKLVVELRQCRLRQILEEWGDTRSQIKGLGSLKLMDRIIQLVIIANDSGLRIDADFDEIQLRYQRRLGELAEGQHLPFQPRCAAILPEFAKARGQASSGAG
jgi:hypothetical protein